MGVVGERVEKALTKGNRKPWGYSFQRWGNSLSVRESALSESTATVGASSGWDLMGKSAWSPQMLGCRGGDNKKRQESWEPWLKNGEECPLHFVTDQPEVALQDRSLTVVIIIAINYIALSTLCTLVHLMIRNLRCREVNNLSKVELVSSRALNLGSLVPGSMCLSLSCFPNDWQERTRVHKTLDYVCFFIPAIPKWVTPIRCVL